MSLFYFHCVNVFSPFVSVFRQNFYFWPLVLLQGRGCVRITLDSLLRELGVSSPATRSEACPIFSTVGFSKAAAAHVLFPFPALWTPVKLGSCGYLSHT